MAAIAATLARYSEQIITDVTHPVSGLPSKKSWLPTVKEVHDACEELDEAERHRAARERRIAEQLADRAREDEQNAVKPTYDQLKAKYGPDWGIAVAEQKRGPPAPAPTIEQLRHHYQHYNLAFRPKNKEAAE